MAFGVSVGDVLKVCEIAMRVYKNCRDCPGEYKALTREARNVFNVLTDISDKLDIIPDNKRPALLDAYEPCVEVLQELDKILLHYNSLDTRSKRAWDRLKWDSDKSRSLRERLTSSVVLLNSFYTSLLVDSQVLILEALGRLEHDYRGGHREESIASIEKIAVGTEDDEDVDDVAWPQIIRDLEDCGISPQDAIDYRDFIVDWFVRAVNEGRLLEESTENVNTTSQTPYDNLTETFNNALPIPPMSRTDGTSHSTTFREIADTSNREPIRLDVSPGEPTPSAPPLISSNVPSPSSREDRSTEPPTPFISRPPTYSDEAPAPHNNVTLHPYEAELVLVDPRPPVRSPTGQSLPSYDQIDAWTESDIFSRAQQITDAWDRRDFVTAAKHLEDQLAAVERGETFLLNSAAVQPDRRVLRHLMGVCASYSGDFVKAKVLFESVFNGIYLSGTNIDDGDIAAARWLGDCCLHLDEEPTNAALAWAVALDGLTAKYGNSHTTGRRVASELKSLDYRLQGLQILEQSFRRNHDCSTIFKSAHATEKLSLVLNMKALKDQMSPPDQVSVPTSNDLTTAALKSLRPHTDWKVARGFLVQPLVSQNAWPLQWDPTFDPVDTINLRWHMHSNSFAGAGPFQYHNIPSIGLMSAKDMLDFVSKRDIRWLADAVRKGLSEMGVEFKEQSAVFMCRVGQQREGFFFSEGIGIKFKKVQFRSMYGVRVTDVQFATRGVPSTGFLLLDRQKKTDGFRDVLIGILQTAENEAKMAELQKKS